MYSDFRCTVRIIKIEHRVYKYVQMFLNILKHDQVEEAGEE